MITQKEELYAQSVAKGMTHTMAAAAAGLDKPPASQGVKNRVSQLKSEVQTNLGLTKEKVLQGFLDAVALSETATEMIAGYREIGKMLGYYEPQKVEVTVTTGAIGHLSNDRLIELADMGDVIDGQYHLVDE